jgi:hypothetical protein
VEISMGKRRKEVGKRHKSRKKLKKACLKSLRR